MSTVRPAVGLWVAAVATTLALGLPLVANADGTIELPGRALTVRVLLVGALALVLRCALRRRPASGHDRQLLTVALLLLVFSAALVVRAITPTGAILLSVAICGVLWQRWRSPDRELARR